MNRIKLIKRKAKHIKRTARVTFDKPAEQNDVVRISLYKVPSRHML